MMRKMTQIRSKNLMNHCDKNERDLDVSKVTNKTNFKF